MISDLYFQDGKTVYRPIVVGEVKWTTERRDSPGKLEFTIYDDGKVPMSKMGNPIVYKYNGKNIFYGFVFEKSMTSDHQIKMVAYDQLRYFKNKDTYVYKNKTITDVVKMLARDFSLRTGHLENSYYKIPQRIEDDKTLFDIVGNAIDETIMKTGEMYCLYDNFGKLELKHVYNMRLPILIDENVTEDYDYKVSIDNDVYNRVKLVYEDKESGKREVYMAQNGDKINEWGVLQYYEKLQNDSNASSKAKQLLKLYCEPKRTLQLKNVLGHHEVRGGSGVVVKMKFNDIKISSFMLVESVTHTFTDAKHTMDLTLQGGKINGK